MNYFKYFCCGIFKCWLYIFRFIRPPNDYIFIWFIFVECGLSYLIYKSYVDDKEIYIPFITVVMALVMFYIMNRDHYNYYLHWKRLHYEENKRMYEKYYKTFDDFILYKRLEERFWGYKEN